MQDFTPTPHNAARKGEIAKTVLMPGDPLRAKYIAENFLDDYKLVSSVRNIYCYTGTYQGKPVSVMAHGMGAGSVGIYTYELFHFYDVDTIIRVGSAGGMQQKTKMRDVVIAMSAATDSNYVHCLHLPGTPTFCADYELLEKAVKYGRENNIPLHVGPVLSSDCFYMIDDEIKQWAKIGILATEMETAIIYANAMEAGKKALSILTISDVICGDCLEGISSEEREKTMNDMIRMGLSLV